MAFWKNYLWTNLSFSYSLKITYILITQVISLKKMVVLSVKFTIIMSWSPICIPLILLLALMRLASTSAAILYNSLGSWHHWQTHIGVKEAMYFNSRFDIGICNVNRFVSISELLQNRKDKINSKDITERFLFSLFDSSVMTQIVERVYSKVIIFLIASDWCSPIIVTNVFFAFDS